MRSEFSEFSYGYAVVRDVEAHVRRHLGSTVVPTFPSLRQEKGLGWDVRLDVLHHAVCFQFKLSDFISQRHPQSHSWSAVGRPHYRFRIDTSRAQHQTLLALDDTLGSSAGSVHYVAPAFWLQRDYIDAYQSSAVDQRSVFVTPSSVGGDGNTHSIVFGPGMRPSILSEPVPVEGAWTWDGVAPYTSTDSWHHRAASVEQIATIFSSVAATSIGRSIQGDPIDTINTAASALGIAVVLVPAARDDLLSDAVSHH